MSETNPPFVTREYPAAKNDFLKFQIGYIKGHVINGKIESIFHLCGWGSTLRAAEIMAGKSETNAVQTS